MSNHRISILMTESYF